MEELIENLNLEDMNYYYHITSKGYGMDIIENGLYMEENDLRSTTIKLPQSFLDNPEEYCKSEYTNSHIKRQEMVIIGCYQGDEAYLIERADIPKFTGDQRMDYFIKSENILGYIDLESLNVICNPEYGYDYRI